MGEKILKPPIKLIIKKAYLNSLSTYNIPDPDMLIRTGGYQRISDFMLYQIAFTELFLLRNYGPIYLKKM